MVYSQLNKLLPKNIFSKMFAIMQFILLLWIFKINKIMKIKSIQKGYGDGDIFYSTDTKVLKKYQVDYIKEEVKQVADNHTINVYRGYIEDKLVFEMGASIDVTIVFWQ